MKLLLLGANGQLGWELQRTLAPLGDVVAVDRSMLDLCDDQQLRNYLQQLQADVIVNAAAYTAVDKAESEAALAGRINHGAVKTLAEMAEASSALLIHYSTDYVFDGSKASRYCEQDATNPLNVYGASKLAGENAILESGVDALIFRTSWVYAGRGVNFLKTICRLAYEREELNIVCDQIGAPTWARLIAETSAHCLHQALSEKNRGDFSSGLYHLTAQGTASWYDFARLIVNKLRGGDNAVRLQRINAIASTGYPTAARRPLNSRLNTERLEQHFGLIMPSWQTMLELCMAEMDQREVNLDYREST